MEHPSVAPAPPPLAAGTKIARRYLVEVPIGQGGMAGVYRVLDAVTGESVALKQLRMDVVERKPAVSLLFEREFHTLKQLAHPRIIRAFDYGVDEGRPYYTMELLDGEDLLTLAPLPWREACAMLRDVASSLAIVHSRRLLHRDVSPRNVRRGEDGRAKLFDFGAMATIGVSGEVIGTPPCIAPEVLHGQALDVRADLYALGALAYWTLTGVHAYPARTIGGLRDAWRSRPRAPSTRVPGLPPALDQLVLSLVSLDPLARPVSAAEVIDRLTVVADLPPEEPVEVVHAYLSAPTLLGRSQEVLRFRKQVLRAGRGRGSVAIVEAEAGLGRTRLLHAIELEGKLAGAAVLHVDAGATVEREWGTLRALARDALTALPESVLRAAGPLPEALCAVLPEVDHLGRPSGHPKPRASQPPEQDVEAAACRWLLGLCAKQSLVIAVDNAHRADGPSLSVLSLLGQDAPDRRLALVLSEERSGGRGCLALEGLRRKATRMVLGPLDQEQTAQLVASVFGDVPNLTSVASWMYKLARGNPRTCMELARHLLARGMVRYEEGAFVLPASLPEAELPTSFEDALEQRLDGLSDTALELVAGLALSDVPLALEEYAGLIADGGGTFHSVFATLDELVGAGVLVTQEDAYGFSQGGFVDALRRRLDDEAKRRISLRLSRVFAKRHDLARQASHLLHAGEELTALSTMMTYYAEISAYIGFDRAPELPPGDARYTASVDDTTAAVRTRELLLDVCERYGRPERERFFLRSGIMVLANRYDQALMRGHAERQLERLAHDSGAVYWHEFAAIADAAQRVKACRSKALEVYHATPEHDRVLKPDEALGAMMLTIGVTQALGRQGYELPVMEQALQVAEFLRAAIPGAEMTHRSTLHSTELVRGRLDSARELRAKMLEYYDAAVSSGKPLHGMTVIGRAIALVVEGHDRAQFGREDAEACASILESPLYPDRPEYARGDYIWLRRAFEIRRLLHLYRGEATGAREALEQIERLSARHAYAAYGGGSAFLEAQAFALSGDLMGLKQSLEVISRIVELQYPCWEPFLHVATGDYQRLRGEPGRALVEYDRALATTHAGSHAAWAPAMCSRVHALIEIGQAAAALEQAEVALQSARDAGLGFLAEHSLEAALALAEAHTGATGEGARRLEAILERALEAGLEGIGLGVLHEARARIAIVAGDVPGFVHAADATASIYRKGRNPALAAKYERLVEAARSAKLALSAEVMQAEIVNAMGLSDGHGYHTQFEDCQDEDARRVRALDLMLERTGAESGFLYKVGERGAISLVVARPDETPPRDLQSALEAYLKAELDDTSDVTMTCFDDVARSAALGLSEFRPVLVTEAREGERAIVGIAALRCPGEFVAPKWDLLSVVSQVLTEQPAEVVSMFG